MPVTHNKGALHPDHPFARGVIIIGQKRPAAPASAQETRDGIDTDAEPAVEVPLQPPPEANDAP